MQEISPRIRVQLTLQFRPTPEHGRVNEAIELMTVQSILPLRPSGEVGDAIGLKTQQQTQALRPNLEIADQIESTRLRATRMERRTPAPRHRIPLHLQVPPLPLSSPEMIRHAQTALKDQGYYEGTIDGQLTPRTSNALRTFQRERHLPETGNLDDATAKALGILGGVNADDRRAGKTQSRDTVPVGRSAPARDSAAGEPPAGVSDAVLANVVSAIANRDPDGAITVVINTQANTGGWRWFGDHVVNGDTLEVYARGVRPTGITTQVLTRGRIELNIDEGVDYVRRLVVHSAGGDMNVLIRNTGGSSRDSASGRDSGPSRDSAPRRDSGPARDTTPVRETSPPVRESVATPAPVSVQRKAEDLLAEYQRLVGVRLTGTGLEFESRATRDEDEIELLFALDSFANASQLYARLLPSLRDNQSLRSAALALSREARRSDRLFSTSSSRAANTLTAKWDSIRQDILKLMQNHRISSTDLDF